MLAVGICNVFHFQLSVTLRFLFVCFLSSWSVPCVLVLLAYGVVATYIKGCTAFYAAILPCQRWQ